MVSSPDRTALYTGVTSDLFARIQQHKEKAFPKSFSAQYNCIVLVYYQHFESIEDAIAEEKRIKAGSRIKKEQMINAMNEEWKDLFDDFEPTPY